MNTLLRATRKLGRELRKLQYNTVYAGQPIVRNGLSMRLHTHDSVSREIFVRGIYGDEELRLLLGAAEACATFIDCGANIGAVCVPLASQTSLKGLAIEPVAANAALLRQNLSDNKLSDRVDVCQVAVGDAPGEAEIFLSPDNKGDHRVRPDSVESRAAERIQVSTIDSLLAERSGLQAPFLIKLDLQGYDIKALRGAQRTIEQPCFICMEFWPQGFAEVGSDIRDLERMFKAGGYHVYARTKASPKLQPSPDLQELAKGLKGLSWGTVVATNMQAKVVRLP